MLVRLFFAEFVKSNYADTELVANGIRLAVILLNFLSVFTFAFKEDLYIFIKWFQISKLFKRINFLQEVQKVESLIANPNLFF